MKVTCKECNTQWQEWELHQFADRGEDGCYECPKCGESLRLARCEDSRDPFDKFIDEMDAATKELRELELYYYQQHLDRTAGRSQ